MKTNEALRVVYDFAKRYAPDPDGCDEVEDIEAAYIQDALEVVRCFIVKKGGPRKPKIKPH